ncbi:MAG TPA: hypothetical protein VMV57_08085 [Terracidiphilus sp.]|nr:hypothetical protein [Terracidiphilus sp.]
MANDLESAPSATEPVQETDASNWLKVGALAVASALAGGLAVMWFYRNTLAHLRQAEDQAENSDFQMPETDDGEDF